MARHSKIFTQIPARGSAHLAAAFWISVLLSICHITEAGAMSGARLAYIAEAGLSAPAIRLTPIQVAGRPCGREWSDCEEDGRRAYHGRAAQAAYRAPRPARYDRRHPPEAIICEEGFVYDPAFDALPAPEPYHYDPDRRYECGVRCWYKRLTTGYCGRGCDYYRFRTGKKRLACRPAY